MALSKKPPQRPAAIIPESEVEALINKGGGVPTKPNAPAAATSKKTTAPQRRTLSVLPSGKVPVQLRLDPGTVEQIDALIRKRLVPVSRHVWLMEAIMEKIKKESE